LEMVELVLAGQMMVSQVGAEMARAMPRFQHRRVR
jgi:hypothetical protein